MQTSCLQLVNSRLRFVVPVLLAVTLGGCGAKKYEQRLEETEKYFSYRKKMDDALVSSRGDFKEAELRVPVGFVPIPLEEEADADAEAAPTEGADQTPTGEPPSGSAALPGFAVPIALATLAQVDAPGNTTTPPVSTDAAPERPLSEAPAPVPLPGDEFYDPRQPDYVDLRLPGLVGAWRMKADVKVGDETVERFGYIYLVSNQPIIAAIEKRRKEKKEEEAKKIADPAASGMRFKPELFFGYLTQRLAHVVESPQSLDDAWRKHRVPSGEAVYSKPRTFQFNGSPQLRNVDINGVPMDFLLYGITGEEQKNVQVAVLFVVPSVKMNSRFKESIDFCLQSLKIKDASGKKRTKAVF